MANMTGTERSMYERPELGDPQSQRLLQAKRKRTIAITIAVLVAIAIPLSIAAADRLDGWASWVVLGAIVWTTVGLMIAISTRMN